MYDAYTTFLTLLLTAIIPFTSLKTESETESVWQQDSHGIGNTFSIGMFHWTWMQYSATYFALFRNNQIHSYLTSTTCFSLPTLCTWHCSQFATASASRHCLVLKFKAFQSVCYKKAAVWQCLQVEWCRQHTPPPTPTTPHCIHSLSRLLNGMRYTCTCVSSLTNAHFQYVPDPNIRLLVSLMNAPKTSNPSNRSWRPSHHECPTSPDTHLRTHATHVESTLGWSNS